jgi:hypothetical protein
MQRLSILALSVPANAPDLVQLRHVSSSRNPWQEKSNHSGPGVLLAHCLLVHPNLADVQYADPLTLCNVLQSVIRHASWRGLLIYGLQCMIALSDTSARQISL